MIYTKKHRYATFIWNTGYTFGYAQARLGAKKILALLTKVHLENLHLLNQGYAIFTRSMAKNGGFFPSFYTFFIKKLYI